MAGFLLTNKTGGYFLSGVSSRYRGLYFRDHEAMFKVIDAIDSDGKIKEIINNFYNIEVVGAGFKGIFFMPHGHDSLVYELDKEKKVELLLDCRESYDSSVWGKFYEITEENEKIIVRFIKKQDEAEQFSLYLVIDKKDIVFSKKEAWVKQHYILDEKRKSHPYEWFVYSALKLKGKRIVFSVGKNKENAVKENDFVLRNLEKLKKKQKDYYKNLFSGVKIKEKGIQEKYKNAVAALDSLACRIDNVLGVYAGLPWFFQFWSRDELVSVKSLARQKTAKKILLHHLGDIAHDGRLLNIESSLDDKTNADSIGWLFKRLSGLSLNKKERSKIAQKLEFSISSIKKNFMQNGLIFNRALETWMDTNWENDTREGFRIEIQAMFLFMLKLAYLLTKKKDYKKEEEAMKVLVREKFWNGMILADGLDDFTARPNLFIAAYFYPELLTRQEWSLCFQYALSKLWLDWGGLATIDKNNRLFCKKYSGETPVSYHRGDSWFWLNSLAAIVMHKNDPRRFKKYIDKIVKANIHNISEGIVGCNPELSSAKELKSEGSLCQAWSNAMFIELVDELY